MIKLFYRLFNHDKLDENQRTIDIYKERNEQLEAEVREYKGYKLKYEVTKLYVEDDDALLELFDVAKKHEYQNSRLSSDAARQQAAMYQGAGGGIGGLAGAGQSQFDYLRQRGY